MFRNIFYYATNIFGTISKKCTTGSNTLLKISNSNFTSKFPTIMDSGLMSGTAAVTSTTQHQHNQLTKILNSVLLQKYFTNTITGAGATANDNSCKRISIPNCAKGNVPPKCVKFFVHTKCNKILAPLPNFNECQKQAPKKKPADECNCFRKVPACAKN